MHRPRDVLLRHPLGPQPLGQLAQSGHLPLIGQTQGAVLQAALPDLLQLRFELIHFPHLSSFRLQSTILCQAMQGGFSFFPGCGILFYYFKGGVSVDRRLTGTFLALEGALYAAFLTLDLTGRAGQTIPLKYAGVLLCLLYAALCALRGGDRLTPAALALTAAADWFLLVRGDHLVVGVGLFLGVQTLYLLRLRMAGAPRAYWLRTGLPLLMGVIVWQLGLLSPLNLLVCLYFSQLLSNAALAWAVPRQRRFAAGLTLFVGCDVCVGLFNLGAGHALSSVGMWLFYLPSQVLIALSGERKSIA